MDSKQQSDIATYKNFIDGKWVAPGSGEYYEVFNPANKDEVVGRFPLSTTSDVENAVASADRAFAGWKSRSASERADFLVHFSEILDRNKERVAQAATKEQGKLYKESLSEPTRGAKEIRIIAGEAVRLEGIARPSDSKRTTNYTERVPIGVVAAITPWNFPVLTPIRKIAPALAAGCTVVFKPATATPLCGVRLAELFEEAQFPAGVVNLLIGSGRKIGDALVGNPLIKGVTFTGSTLVGRNINKTVAPNFTKVQLEMGGKNAAVVVEYGDLKGAAANIIKAAYTNAGQRCTAISRVIVLESQADELERLLVQEAEKTKVGDGMDPTVTMGPIVSQDALETIASYVESAVKEGAKIATGGKQLSGGVFERGYYFAPTVITNVTASMKVAKEEIFGPVLAVIRVKARDEAIKVCNGTEYGLTATVYTDKMSFAYDFMSGVEVGMVRVNNLGVSGGNMPFGGVKHSGLGAFSIGHTTMDFYTNQKVVYIEY